MYKKIKKKFQSLGLIGYPLKKTLSPDIFKFLFKKRKIRGRYKVLRIPPKTFPLILKKLKYFDGLNITIPYKVKFPDFCRSFKNNAGLIKAVNTLKNRNGKFTPVKLSASGGPPAKRDFTGFTGYNTDIYGFKKALQSEDFNPQNKKCCIFGAGGAARAVLFVLFSSGAKSITVVSRNIKKAALNLTFLKSAFPESRLFFSAKAPCDCNIYVNATPGENSDFPLDGFPSGAVFFDLNYSLSETRFLKRAMKLGAAHIMDGKEMLFYQAIKSFMIWTGERINFKEIEELKKEFFALKNVYIAGFAGSGKTETGRILAKKLKRPFYDTDIELEKSEKKRVSEIIRTRGLGYFRKKEKQMLKKLAELKGSIISLGGGITLSRNNGFSLTRSGICVYLDCGIECLKKRLSKNPGLRPLICTDNRQISEGKIKNLYFKRLKHYRNANIHIKTRNLKPEKIAKKILRILYKNNEI